MIKHKRRLRLPLPRGRNRVTAIGIAAFTAAILLLVGYMASTRSVIEDGVYTVDGVAEEFSMPLRLRNAPAGDIIILFGLHLAEHHPASFRIVPDDCLESLNINGEDVGDAGLPFCDFTNGEVLDLSAYLQPGENIVIARISNGGGDAQLQWQPVWGNAAVFVPWLLLVALITGLCLFLLTRVKPAPWISWLCILFLAAAFLRGYYLLSTPYWVRGHDTDGHIEYIDYIAEHGRLPAPDEGWEYWQPPLYYAVGAVWAKSAAAAGIGRGGMLFGMQVLSSIFSLLILACVAWAGIRLFPDPKERSAALPLFFGLIAFFPGLVYLSARINNDVPAVLFAFAAACALLEWWKSGSRTWWCLLMLAIALHILTKANGLLLLPVAYVCLLARRGNSWKRTFADGLTGLLIVGVVAGWFNVYRLTHDGSQDMIIGNTQTLNTELRVPNDAAAYTVFSPVGMIRHPYNNPFEDSARRRYFWEYWYRSAFFGEFDFGEGRRLLASWILASSFIVLLIALAGFIRTIPRRFYAYLPMAVLAAALPLGHAVFRFRYPYASSQDFRYSLLVLLPWALYVTLGIVLFRSPAWRKIATTAAHVFIAFCIAFLLHF